MGTGNPQSQGQCGVLTAGGGAGGGTGGAGGRGGSGQGGSSSSSSNSPSLGAGGSLSVELPASIQSAVEAPLATTMQGVTAVTTTEVEARSAADNLGRGLYLIMKAHLRHICCVVGDDDIPFIWRDMALARTKAESLELLLQFFLTGMSACQSIFHGHVDLLHISLPLFNFVARGAFTNHGYHPACPSGGISPWTSIQILVDRVEAVALTLSDIGAQDSCLANAYRLARGAKVTLSVIVGADNLRRELGIFCYILPGLFVHASPCVCVLKGVVEWATSNQDAFERAISNSHQATALLDEVSRLLSEYLNACVQASCTGNLTHPVSLTPFSFLHLRSKIKFLPYHGIACLHPTLQALVRYRDIHRVAAGLPTPGSLESNRIGIAVAAEMKRAGGRGGNEGSGRGNSGGN